MNSLKQEQNAHKKGSPVWILYVMVASAAIFLSFYFYSQSLIRIKAPEPATGKKVVITLPEGNKIYTYENFIVEEDGKLLYKGERSTLDFTGGKIDYENWN
nr:hypothetical protein [uncultured Bacillus sp.]